MRWARPPACLRARVTTMRRLANGFSVWIFAPGQIGHEINSRRELICALLQQLLGQAVRRASRLAASPVSLRLAQSLPSGLATTAIMVTKRCLTRARAPIGTWHPPPSRAQERALRDVSAYGLGS